MPARRVKEYLDENNVRYTTISHSPAYTAQEIAAKAHIPGQELAKTVCVKVDGRLAMAVLPASYSVDFQLLQEVTGAERLELATETDFRDRFPECELGAMPPFGNLYGMDVYVAVKLTEDKTIAFSAGSHSELIRMHYADYERLVNPKVVPMAFRAAGH